MLRFGRLAVVVLAVTLGPSGVKGDSVAAAAPSTSDFWDISQGVVITGNSPVLGPPLYAATYASDIRDMFGGRFSPVEPGNTMFQDRQPTGTVHWVEWRTPSPVTLRSFELSAVANGPWDTTVYPDMMRGFTRFSLLVRGADGAFRKLFEISPAKPYGDTRAPSGVTLTTDAKKSLLNICANLPETAGQEFRAEFVQYNLLQGFENASGPRIVELDGYAAEGCSMGSPPAAAAGAQQPAPQPAAPAVGDASEREAPVDDNSGSNVPIVAAAAAAAAAITAVLVGIRAVTGRASATAAAGAATAVTRPAESRRRDEGVRQRSPCADEQERVLAASASAKAIQGSLQTMRNLYNTLEEQWENSRESSFWGGAIDVAMLGGSIWAKPAQAAMGIVVKQTLAEKVVESMIKGFGKELAKDFVRIASDENVNLTDLFTKAGQSGGKKLVLEKLKEEIVSRKMQEFLRSGLRASDFRGVTVSVEYGAAYERIRKSIGDSVTPITDAISNLLDLWKLSDGVMSRRKKLEAFEAAEREARQHIFVLEQQLEDAMSELQFARTALNNCKALLIGRGAS